MTDCITTPEALAVSAGYLVPRLVREIEDAPAKVSLTPRLSVPRAASHGSSAGGC